MKRMLLAALVLSLCGRLAAAPLHLVTEEVAPSVMKRDGKISGYSTDKVRAILERSAIAYRMDLYPWSRTYSLVQSQAQTCAFPMTRLPEREPLFKWVGPLHVSDWTLYGRASDGHVIKSLEDARGLRIGSFVGDPRVGPLKQAGLLLEYVGNDLLNVKKLQLGRIDLWVGSKRHAEIEIARHGLRGQIVPVYTFRQSAVYLACHPSVADAEIARMNSALHSLREDGSIAAIEARYMQ